MGDLMYFYGVSLRFCRGSLVDVGGHNPMEPGLLGKPIMMVRIVEILRTLLNCLNKPAVW